MCLKVQILIWTFKGFRGNLKGQTVTWPSQGFWYFARSRSREFQVNPRNPAKFTKTREIPRNSLEILPNTCRHNIFESYLGCWGCLLAVNLLIYLETSSLQRVNNIPKLLGVLRLMLRKSGKHPGVPRPWKLGMRVRQLVLSCVRSSWRMLRFVKDCASYVHLTYKDDDLFRNGRFGPRMIMPENLQNEQSSCMLLLTR